MRGFLIGIGLALLVAPLTVAQPANNPVEHEFEGYFRCAATVPYSDPERCAALEERRDKWDLWINSTWTMLRVRLTWDASAGAGVKILELKLNGTGLANALNVTSSQGVAELELLASMPSVHHFEIQVLKATKSLATPRRYSQTFNVTVLEYLQAEGSPAENVLSGQPKSTPAASPEAARRPELAAAPTGPAGHPADFDARFLSPLALLVMVWPQARAAAAHWLWAFLRLFARHPPDRLLEHPRRRFLVDMIKNHPGIRVGELQRMSRIPNGAFGFHIHLLLRHGLVRRAVIGSKTVLFSPAAHAPIEEGLGRRLQRILVASPGLAQVELAQRLGVPVKTLHYHVTQLRRVGRLRLVPDGKASRVYWNG